MKCLQCDKENKTSILTDLGYSMTLLGGYNTFYDENGIKHHHNPNTKETTYRCSNGHIFNKKSKIECPNCEYANN